MFTGIVERTAPVIQVLDRPGSRLLRIRIEDREDLPAWRHAERGESIAVNGVCLTVVESGSRAGGNEVAFEAVPETLGLTTLGRLAEGDPVNLERALRVGDAFGGHHVTGHVDAIGRIRARREEGDQVVFEIDAPDETLRGIIHKGSIAVDGISLTVTAIERRAGWFSFAAIPHTLALTTLGRREPGDPVNLETDAFGKWVLHGLEEARAPAAAKSGGLLAALVRGGFVEEVHPPRREEPS